MSYGFVLIMPNYLCVSTYSRYLKHKHNLLMLSVRLILYVSVCS